MDLIDRYLNAVAAQLPQDERADIVAELRDLILSRFEAKEEALGRALTGDEQEAILREIGHPLVVAARYRKGPDSLVGPELFPYWLFGVKAGLMVLGAVYAITLFIRLISGADDAGQAIAQAFHGFFGAGPWVRRAWRGGSGPSGNSCPTPDCCPAGRFGPAGSPRRSRGRRGSTDPNR